MKLVAIKPSDPDFQKLIIELDKELKIRYGDITDFTPITTTLITLIMLHKAGLNFVSSTIRQAIKNCRPLFCNDYFLAICHSFLGHFKMIDHFYAGFFKLFSQRKLNKSNFILLLNFNKFFGPLRTI